ncbi:MAG: sensor histidine kinase [Clostridia bacterium]|nr:sensor histidine kinase [Clostridia bacterium]
MNQEQRLMAKENIDLINRKCHDIKHQIENLRCLTTNTEMQQNLQELENCVGIYDSILKTGNSTLDAVLTEKKLFCERYKINFSCIIDGCTLGFMEDEDIYALFGNALDNAVECVIKNTEETQRLISIKVSPVGKMLSIHFDNYCENEIVWKDGLPMTGKVDRASHGYGMRSIRHVVDKYQGTMTVFQKDNMFNLNIVLPIPDKENGE